MDGIYATWGRICALQRQDLCYVGTAPMPCMDGISAPRGRICTMRGRGECPHADPSSTISPCRLERLQRIVSKLQMESGLCEEQLNQADTLLQSVSGGSGCGVGAGWRAGP